MMEHVRRRPLRPRGYLLRAAQWALALLLVGAGTAWAAGTVPAPGSLTCQSTDVSATLAQATGSTPIGPGDLIAITVYGQQDLTGTQTVAGNGTIRIALVDKPLQIGGLSPPDAASLVARALQDNKILLHPSVTIKVEKSVNNFVSVLGEVHKPDRYAIDAATSLFDLLAVAGGLTDNASDVVCLSRRQQDGSIVQIPVALSSIEYNRSAAVQLRAGDSIFVEPLPHFFILGEVKAPHEYPLTSGMTVGEALSAAGGLTDRGSSHRIEIRRPTGPKQFDLLHVKLGDPVEPNDLVIVRESIF
jgi:polysaccharide biosynthesis/export protein